MKAKQITIGGVYIARVSGRLVPVRVDNIRRVAQFVRGGLQTVYDVTNLVTKRTTTFRSAQRFRRQETPGNTRCSRQPRSPLT